MVYSVVGMADTEEAPTRPARTNRPQPRQQNSGLLAKIYFKNSLILKKLCSRRRQQCWIYRGMGQSIFKPESRLWPTWKLSSYV